MHTEVSRPGVSKGATLRRAVLKTAHSSSFLWGVWLIRGNQEQLLTFIPAVVHAHPMPSRNNFFQLHLQNNAFLGFDPQRAEQMTADKTA